MHRGGDGLIRELEALETLEVSIISERRTRAPFGLAGGGDGKPGINSASSHSVSGNSVSGNSVSGNSVSGHSVSGNSVSGNSVSGNSVSGNSVSGNSTLGTPLAAKVSFKLKAGERLRVETPGGGGYGPEAS